MKQKLTQLGALFGLFALVTAACTPSASTPTRAPDATRGSAQQAEAPATGEPIKIGYVWGVTGAAADIVRPASEATHAYFDALNKNGGIKGRPVQMVELDSKYQVPLAQEGYKKV